MIYLDEAEITANDCYQVVKAMKSGQVSTKGDLVPIFENALARFYNYQFAIATNSGTSALHLAILNTKPIEKFYIPVLTFAATRNAVWFEPEIDITYLDVNPYTWTADVKEIDGCKQSVFMAVDIYGNPCLTANLPYRCTIIRDAAQSVGSTNPIYDDDYRCVSFNGNKIVTTGSGGALLCKYQSDGEIILNGAISGGNRLNFFRNYRMNNMQAALGLSQIERIKSLVSKKRRMNEIYREELPMLKFQDETVGCKSNYWMTACLFPSGVDIEELRNDLKEHGIPTRRIFRPLSSDKDKFPFAWDIYQRGLCLPSSTKNSYDDIRWVCDIIRRIVL